MGVWGRFGEGRANNPNGRFKPPPKPDGSTFRCQKCLEKGHFTYECMPRYAVFYGYIGTYLRSSARSVSKIQLPVDFTSVQGIFEEALKIFRPAEREWETAFYLSSRVHRALIVHDEFSSRHDALSRTYMYRFGVVKSANPRGIRLPLMEMQRSYLFAASPFPGLRRRFSVQDQPPPPPPARILQHLNVRGEGPAPPPPPPPARILQHLKAHEQRLSPPTSKAYPTLLSPAEE
ncbi:unnamed protein product [Cyprideis torosa]|uniref:Uncharacterized protein n=1 Tax=Cyprideis torosa TaxID=163714 RepID=A0A7R8W641_9CRUS|nr:unnamed protein product [Cyprideis torosa]CAG0882139.1 unnamed protein product [Cyprideis torosa]